LILSIDINILFECFGTKLFCGWFVKQKQAKNKNPHHFGWGLKSSEIKIWRA